jgi:hypothetical protein
MEAETRLSATSIPATPPTAGLAATFSSRKARAAVLLELLGLAYADGEYNPRESEVVKASARAFGIAEPELLQMENWVLRQMALAVEAEHFLAEEQ